jgi:23S rRNA (guanosine2251-2'-O)-methyltransferase
MFVILDNLRSAYNVGSLLRTADAVGAELVYLVGTTPAPLDRFGRARIDIAKTALGAEMSVPYEYHADILPLLASLKSKGVLTVAIEQDDTSVPYTSFVSESAVKLRHTAFIFGNEVEGVAPSTLAHCDHILDILMSGKKESLNVAVTAGIILFHFRDCAR